MPEDPYATLPDAPKAEEDPYASISDKPVPMKSTSPVSMQGGVVPQFHPENVVPFAKQVGAAAKQDVGEAGAAIKQGSKEWFEKFKHDPSIVVPSYFELLTKPMEAFAHAVSTPVEYAFQGDIPSALSSAAGGDPTKAQAYRDEGNSGGEFWEMLGKPLALLATGKALGAIGGTVAEGAEMSRLRVVRSIMGDASTGKTGISVADAQLAQQSLQDAARKEFGTGGAGVRKAGKALPSRDKGFTDILSGNPPTASRVEAGNKSLIDLSRKAVEIAGEPADEVNRVYGYMPGQQSATNIRNDLLQQASDAESKGLTSYGKALRERASSMDKQKTLGDIYNVKKSANRLAEVGRNTQEAIDLMDSWSALASAIRKEVYPIYDQQVAHSSMPGFSLAQAGRKEGAAMQLRNGLEKRWAKAQADTDALHTPGQSLQQASHGLSPEHTIRGSIIRKGQEKGILPSPQGNLNTAGKKAIGRLSSETSPESLAGGRFTPRKTGKIPVKHGLRAKAPVIAADVEREYEEEQ